MIAIALGIVAAGLSTAPVGAASHAHRSADVVTKKKPKKSKASKRVDPSKNPCGLLTRAEIHKAIGISVASGTALPGGCRWIGTSLLHDPGPQAKAVLGGHEGVVLAVKPTNGTFDTSHLGPVCTSPIPGISGAGAVCTGPVQSTKLVAFEIRGGLGVLLVVYTNQGLLDGPLEQLARVANSHVA